MQIRNRTNFAFAPLMGRVNFPAHTATLVVKAGFRINDDGTVTPMDPPAAIEGDVTAGGAIAYSVYDADLAYYKPQADLLLNGTAYTPGGKPATTCPVTFKVGEWSKTLAAIGNRTWQKGLVRSKAGEPEPFTKVALTWANAYGGPKHDANPAGKGQKDGVLPNIEYPDDLITSTSHKPKPACFLPVHRTWAERTRKMGTYDNKWLKERWPAFPADLDWTHFNAAPEDQQLRGFLRGDEEVELVNLHPERERVKARLPGLRVRLLLRETDELKLREVQMNLDTLYVDADKLELYLTWRGIANVSDDDWEEVREILIAHEPLIDAPLPPEQLLPLFANPDDDIDFEIDPPIPAEEIAARNAATDAEMAKVEQMAAKYEQEALNAIKDKLPPGVKLESLMKPSTSGFADIEKALTSFLNQHTARGAKVPAGLNPKDLNPFNDPQFKQMLNAAQKPPKPPMPAEKAKLSALLRSGESTGGYFAETDLAGEDLSNSDLRDASFNRANLAAVSFAGSNLSGASFNDADLSNADFSGANLTDADLSGANLSGAKFHDAELAHSGFSRAVADNADFTGAKAEQADFTQMKAPGALFKGAKLSEAVFSGAVLERADFTGAELPRAAFDQAVAKSAIFDEADLTNLRAEKADFSDATFQRIKAPDSLFEKANLTRADFGDADLPDAQFQGADMTGCRLYGADLKGAVLRGTKLVEAKAGNANFFGALLEKADLTGAQAQQSNFYTAEFFNAVTDGADFSGSNLKQTKLADR